MGAGAGEATGEGAPNVGGPTSLPRSLLLDRVDLVVSQGGAGGTLGALLHGLPHLVLPQGAQSQISAAQSIQQIGAGLSLYSAPQTKTPIPSAPLPSLQHPPSTATPPH